MTAQAIVNPLPIFIDTRTGLPLTGGMVYFGQPDKDPREYPISVWYDEALSIPAAQPVRTNAGYLSRNGSPATVWADGSYSVLALDSAGRQVFYSRKWDGLSSSAITFQQTGPGSVPRSTEDKLREWVTPEDKGAAGDGAADDTQALTDAFSVAGHVRLLPGKTYKFSKLVIPAGKTIMAKGAVLRSDGSLTAAGDITVDIGNGCAIDALRITTPGTETNTDVVRLGADVEIGELSIAADVQRAGGGVITQAQDVRIGTLRASKIDRPIHFYNTGTTAQTTGSYIGLLECTGYVRGFRADFCSFTVLAMKMRGRSVNASNSPGHNSVLIAGCADWQMGDLYLADAGEHAFRIGGAPGAYAQTKNFQVGNIVAKACGGCALKINPTFLVSAGVNEKCENGSFGNIVGIDVGDGALEGNKELVRLTHAQRIRIASAQALLDAGTISAEYLLQVNDVSDIEIGYLYAENANSGFVLINGTSDVDGVSTFGGDVIGLRIGRMAGVASGAPPVNAIAVNTTFNVGDVCINLDGVSGFSTNLLRWIAGTLVDTFELRGRVDGSVAPVIQSAPVSDDFLVDIQYNNTRSVGRASGIRGGTAFIEYLLPVFSSASQAGNGIVINNTRATAGSGNYGGAIEFTRLGSSRRGAAIVPKQGSADDKRLGLDFFVGDSNSTTNEALNLAFSLLYTRRFKFPALTTYADNASAVAAGLTAGELYWTAAGEARVVV